MGNTKYIRLIVVAGLTILLTAFAVPALAQSTTDKEDYSLVPESSAAKEGTAGEEIASGEAVESDDPSVEEDSLIPKGRNRGSQRAVVNQQTNQTNLTDKLKRGGNKTGSPQSANFTQSNSGKTTGIKTAPIRTQNTGISTKDLSKVSIGKQNLSAPISLADKAKPISLSDKSRVTPTSIGSSTASPSSVSPLVKTGPPVSGLIGTSVLKPGLLGGLDKIKPVDIKPIDPGKGNAQGSTTNTQGNVTGGGAGSVTTGGVQSGGGQGSNTQGSTVSTGGGNTVGGIQQSGDNNSVDITQNNTTNVTNVKNVSVGGGGGGGFIGGGGGGGSVDVSPIEYEPEPVVVTRNRGCASG